VDNSPILIDSHNVPEPFIFNSLKHHLGYIRYFIRESSGRSPSRLRSDLKIIGHSRIDLYTGEMHPLEIADHFSELLQIQDLSARRKYKDWIAASNKRYQILTLNDGSRWTFRMGQKSKRHVHIHPARYSPFVTSVKALPLKTAIATLSNNLVPSNQELDLSLVNQVRTEILGVSPLKSLKRDAGLSEIVSEILDLHPDYLVTDPW